MLFLFVYIETCIDQEHNFQKRLYQFLPLPAKTAGLTSNQTTTHNNSNNNQIQTQKLKLLESDNKANHRNSAVYIFTPTSPSKQMASMVGSGNFESEDNVKKTSFFYLAIALFSRRKILVLTLAARLSQFSVNYIKTIFYLN